MEIPSPDEQPREAKEGVGPLVSIILIVTIFVVGGVYFLVMEELERQLKHFIVESLMLEDVKAEDIDSDAPLFVEGLGLDSIDALELGMALTRTYGVKINAGDDRNRDIFRSVSSLAAFIEGHLTEKGSPS